MPMYDPAFASVSQIPDYSAVAREKKKAAAKKAAEAAAEGQRRGTEVALGEERKAIIDALLGVQNQGQSLTGEQKQAAEFYAKVLSGQETAITPQVQAAMRATAEHPFLQEYEAAMGNLRNFYGTAGGLPGGGAESESFRKLRSDTLASLAGAGNQALIAGATTNFANKMGAAGGLAGLGEQLGNQRLQALQTLAGFTQSYPIVGPNSFVKPIKYPVSQPNTQTAGL